MRKLIFEKSQWEKLKELCEAGYPKEVCGLLFGQMGQGCGGGVGGQKFDHLNQPINKVSKIDPLKNILNGNHSGRLQELLKFGEISISPERTLRGGKFEFVIDPAEHYQKVYEAQKVGLDQVGLFHSHPDHPAIPSPTDASQPLLAGWSNLIVSVHHGQFSEARSWLRETEDSTFQEEKILIE